MGDRVALRLKGSRMVMALLAVIQKTCLLTYVCISGFPVALALFLLLGFGTLPLFCATLDLRLAGKELPNQIRLAWNTVDDATWYDFYEGPSGSENFLIRLEASSLQPASDGSLHWTSGGNDQPLAAETSYRIVAAARSADGQTLDAATLTTKTSSWAGRYQWKNPTTDNNGGKILDITLTTKRGPDIPGIPVYYEIYGDFSSVGVQTPQKIFPLFPLNTTSFNWISYKDNSPEATAYRLNAEKYNKTDMKPKSWKVQSIQVGTGKYVTKILTKALGFEISTVSTYTFRIDENDRREICFLNQGSGIASIGLFANPEDGSAPFVLTDITGM